MLKKTILPHYLLLCIAAMAGLTSAKAQSPVYTEDFSGQTNTFGVAVTEPAVGKRYKEGDLVCHITTPWGEIAPVHATISGKVVEVCAKQGATLRKGDPIVYIERDAE